MQPTSLIVSSRPPSIGTGGVAPYEFAPSLGKAKTTRRIWHVCYFFRRFNRDEAGVKALAKLFDKEKIEIREVGDVVRGHLYGESDEFHDLR